MSGDPFYIGYRATMPPEHALRARLAVAVLAALAVGLGFGVSRAQRDAGGGTWEASERQWTGRLITYPSPMLLVVEEDTERTILLVAEGKHGLGENAVPWDGQLVTVTGTQISRESRRMIEVSPGSDAIRLPSPSTPLPAAPRAPATSSPPGEVILTGEVVDPKCFLGAMKPGRGKTHRACAILCISGGIPPMLLLDGSEELVLLADTQGQPANQLMLPYVGDVVEVHARLTLLGDLRVARADQIHRN